MRRKHTEFKMRNLVNSSWSDLTQAENIYWYWTNNTRTESWSMICQCTNHIRWSVIFKWIQAIAINLYTDVNLQTKQSLFDCIRHSSSVRCDFVDTAVFSFVLSNASIVCDRLSWTDQRKHLLHKGKWIWKKSALHFACGIMFVTSFYYSPCP